MARTPDEPCTQHDVGVVSSAGIPAFEAFEPLSCLDPYDADRLEAHFATLPSQQAAAEQLTLTMEVLKQSGIL